MKLSPWEPDLRTIVDRIDNGDIDLQPDFQRQEIWSPGKKRKLIDTILRSWSIPPVFLVVVHDGRMEVLDGQQRLAAIRDFAHSEFSVDGRVTPFNERISALHGKNYKRLDPTTRRLFDQYTLRCFRITDYEPDEPSELFYRLNQPSMLTAGEQRNAFYGPAREQLKQLVSNFEAAGNEKGTIGFSNARLAYDDIIARLVFFLEAHTFGIKGTEALISQRFKARTDFSSEVLDGAEKAISAFSRARNIAGQVRLNKASTLSWLIFYCRLGDTAGGDEFLSYVANINALKVTPAHFVHEALLVFQDRASLRVTDVSSVVYRDFCLWYIFYFSREGKIPHKIDRRLIEDVYSALQSRDDVSFPHVLEHLLPLDQWSVLK